MTFRMEGVFAKIERGVNRLSIGEVKQEFPNFGLLLETRFCVGKKYITSEDIMAVTETLVFEDEVTKYLNRFDLFGIHYYEYHFERRYISLSRFRKKEGVFNSMPIPLLFFIINTSNVEILFKRDNEYFVSCEGIKILNGFCDELEGQNTRTRLTGKNQRSGSKTYLMVDSSTGFVKIGKSKDPKVREGTLQSAKPTITLFAVLDENIESLLHKQYAPQRVRGEWFNISMDEVLDIVNEFGFSVQASH